MPQVDLVYDQECPNVALARTNLLQAFAATGVVAEWSEHLIGSPDAVARVRGFGSPTVLVDGRDVAQAEPGSESCCRVYGSAGAPSVELIASALRKAMAPAAPELDGSVSDGQPSQPEPSQS